MPIAPEILALLRHPLSGEPLRPAPQDLINRINTLISARKLENRIGQTVENSIDEALVDVRGNWLLPIRGGIITMVTDELISTETLNGELDQ